MSEYIIDIADNPSFGGVLITCGEIVRCRDCRAMRVKYGNTGVECWMNGEPFTVKPDGFCAWAKRAGR